MAPANLKFFLQDQRFQAEKALLERAPKSPHFVIYEELRAQILARHVVRYTDVNKVAKRLYREKRLLCPDWEKGRQVPQRRYRRQRA
jgi:hypothetical protein